MNKIKLWSPTLAIVECRCMNIRLVEKIAILAPVGGKIRFHGANERKNKIKNICL